MVGEKVLHAPMFARLLKDKSSPSQGQIKRSAKSFHRGLAILHTTAMALPAHS
jgi:hypothetical protein